MRRIITRGSSSSSRRGRQVVSVGGFPFVVRTPTVTLLQRFASGCVSPSGGKKDSWEGIHPEFSAKKRQRTMINLTEKAMSVLRSTERQQLPDNHLDQVLQNWSQMSWPEYLTARSFLDSEAFERASLELQAAALIVLSSRLTFPMTLAYHMDRLLGGQYQNNELGKWIQIGIVGAEIETTDLSMWQELAFVTGRHSLRIHFIGPRIKERPWLPVTNGRLQVRQTRATVEDALLIDINTTYDAFVAFQPGAGTNHSYTWDEGFEMIMDSGKPLLLTAYDERDAFRDAYWWDHTFGIPLAPYQTNPWASYAPKGLGNDCEHGKRGELILNGMVTFYNAPE